ncbi:Maf family protein [Natronoglycomyces albus]|uniref:Nucleoside triphosphate pyrophosphatase n=1 Tax=Natronoglycomyces albus TaxID=2811108 RepID=A0A895XUM5_9ACTN|nr:nucleoside triphosphate pyrophosphatase [Natronoglycomyces albus]QSB05930.1 septum formation inhibitor Maf [Natronoglycomyces albus]
MTSATAPRLVLASASPARRALLLAAGLEPEVIVSGVDESTVSSKDPATLACQLAALKAKAVAARPETAEALVIGCDSVLAFGGDIYGKPADAEEAAARWKAMRGRSGVLHTGHCLIDNRTGRSTVAGAATTVHFAEVSDEEIAAYIATGEPLRVAGAFTLDGYGSAFVDKIEGDPGTVIGLSMPLLRRMLFELDIPLRQLW